jgi:hypothetical protein
MGDDMTPAQRAAYNKRLEANSTEYANALGGIMGLIATIGIPILIIGAIVAVALTLFRALFELGKVFWLYPIVLLAAIVLMAFVRIALRRLRAIKLLAFLTFAAVCVLGFMGVTKYYVNSSMYLPSMYSADFIQVLPDGSAPKLYEKRHQRGTVLAELSPDQYVIVNGINVNYQEYNITTADGKTGWVVREAFPEDAAEMLGLSITVGGKSSGWETPLDRKDSR